MPSLVARHSRDCKGFKGAQRSVPLDESKKILGCTCPRGALTFGIVIAEGNRRRYEAAGKDRRSATERVIALRGGTARPRTGDDKITFEAWAGRWIEGLERRRSTVRSYQVMLDLYAIPVFGTRLLREVSSDDLARMSRKMKDAKLSDSTRAKHLRGLSACLNAAAKRTPPLLDRVPHLNPSERPRPVRREEGYFTDDERALLLAALPEGLYRTLFRVAFLSGLRKGELIALRWQDVDFERGQLHVRFSYSGRELTSPKSHERRDVDLPPQAVQYLAEWSATCGHPSEGLVFPDERTGSYLSEEAVLRLVLYPALTKAEIPRVDTEGRKRAFHSIRHSYAKSMLEGGDDLYYLQRQMGHSSILVTTERYGHLEPKKRKARAKSLAKAFKGV
jgi:integrase